MSVGNMVALIGSYSSGGQRHMTWTPGRHGGDWATLDWVPQHKSPTLSLTRRSRDPLALGALGAWGRWQDPETVTGSPEQGQGSTGLTYSLGGCEEDPG